MGSELDGEVEVFERLLGVVASVGRMITHGETGAFAPDLSGLGDLLEGSQEGLLGSLEIGRSFAPLVLELDVDGPQSAGGEMGLEALLDHFFRLVEPSASHSLHDGLELDLPLALGKVFGDVHDLEGSVVFLDDLEVLGILEQGNRHLLLGDLETGPLDAESCLFQETLVEHDARSDEPNLPFDVVWALHEGLSQV